MKIEIKSRWDATVLFAYEAENNTVRLTVEAAVRVGARLVGARLDRDEKLIGDRPILQIGPIGSRCAYFVAYITDQGLRLRAGCFYGTRVEFEERVREEHAGNVHQREYAAALNMIDAHVEIWTPAPSKTPSETES